MFGITEFSAVINPPQACILAVGTSVPRVYAAGDNENMVSVNTLRVTVSADRRVVDEEIAERFLSAFKKYIENPNALIL